ncbi:hypothetical protein FB45DRAFT_914802 [Roridomyces roridus]|uniref:Protein kinase domain-containing protein n=1 Tax=Roridomyces roridus TaxID=1738132 RepID=A0AAD7BXW5_9AGAR|nr:hypothetical protein FB45DRAFT_914802 [Roridomyces roridus]
MSFISNAEHLTLKDGAFTNIQVQNVYYSQHAISAPSHDSAAADEQGPGQSPHRLQEEEDDVQVIRKEHLKVMLEIGSGRGDLLHAGEIQGRGVIVKVFHANEDARKRLECTVSFTQGLMHPNVLRIQGRSSPTSSIQFITYESAFWKSAEGPLAAALREDLTRSVAVGFKMIAALASGLNYLKIQGMAFAAVENFHVLLDWNDRFLICLDPPNGDLTESSQAPLSYDVWVVFHALCHKVLTSANNSLYKEGINRTPIQLPNLPARMKGAWHLTLGSPQLGPESTPNNNSVPPRREYIWRKIGRGAQSLGYIASEINRDLELKLLTVPTVTLKDRFAAHRCAGYLREEITLATTVADSTVVSNAPPSPREVCIICREVVGFHERLECVCRSSNLGPTVKCQSCGFWSHSGCALNGLVFSCRTCHERSKPPSPPPLSFPIPSADGSLDSWGDSEGAAFSTTATVGDSLSYQNSAPSTTVEIWESSKERYQRSRAIPVRGRTGLGINVH